MSKLDNWQYDETEDTWTCAAGRKLNSRYESKETTESGYEIRKRHYRSENCEDCPLKIACKKAQGNREISVSLRYQQFKQQAREKLRSDGFRLPTIC
nr:transposase [Cohnella lupini]